ncbi:unnamed protein product [Sphenostylis stenocarpa]|uniref:Uncharacterized protein n=1 Tax=Sphenostylis stenocarpa TaxID=92480 RepID=A0AA86S0K6_9FABA|nr:unnamed protein product [Sphenostylis stenocarpa]
MGTYYSQGIVDWETDEVKIDESRAKPILGNLRVPVVDVGCGSPEIRNSKTMGENSVYREIEFVNLAKDHVVDESNKGVVDINDVEIELMECDSSRENKVEEQEVEILQFEENYNEIDESSRNEKIGENKGLVVNEDGWEEMEITELEERFGAAVVFGPCHEFNPMKFSARAKWIMKPEQDMEQYISRLSENIPDFMMIMKPEQAMEQYISLISENIPDWIAEKPYDNAEQAFEEIRGGELSL